LQALHRLTFDFSLGRHPENLSGAYYQTMDATVPHQFFATSMLVTPFLRGLLGWDPDAPEARAVLAPQPPPSWPAMEVSDLMVGASRIRFTYEREAGEAVASFALEGPPVALTYIQPLPLGARDVQLEGNVGPGGGTHGEGLHDETREMAFTLREGDPVEIRFRWEGGLEVEPPAGPVPYGASSGGLRVLDFTMEGGEWILELEGDGGRSHTLTLYGEGVEADAGDAREIVAGDSGEAPGQRREIGAGLPSPGANAPQLRMTRLRVSFSGTGRMVKTLRLRPRR
jgi:hypothetical protein